MSARFEREPRGLRVESRRTGDIDKIGRLTVEHQRKVIVNAEIEAEIDGLMTAGSDGIVNRAEADVGAGTPSGKMGLRSDFTKAGNNPA